MIEIEDRGEDWQFRLIPSRNEGAQVGADKMVDSNLEPVIEEEAQPVDAGEGGVCFGVWAGLIVGGIAGFTMAQSFFSGTLGWSAPISIGVGIIAAVACGIGAAVVGCALTGLFGKAVNRMRCAVQSLRSR